MNTLVDLEKELKTLKKQIEAKGRADDLSEEDLERLRFLREELAALTDGES